MSVHTPRYYSSSVKNPVLFLTPLHGLTLLYLHYTFLTSKPRNEIVSSLLKMNGDRMLLDIWIYNSQTKSSLPSLRLLALPT